jgi:hypothetical protein
MYVILCKLSDKRQELLREDPDLVNDLLASRHDPDIPGLLNLGRAWDALDVVLSGRGASGEALDDVVLGRSGQVLPVGESTTVLGAGRVAQIADALSALTPDEVTERLNLLDRHETHAHFGHDPATRDDDREVLVELLEKIVSLYQDAARERCGMLCALG